MYIHLRSESGLRSDWLGVSSQNLTSFPPFLFSFSLFHGIRPVLSSALVTCVFRLKSSSLSSFVGCLVDFSRRRSRSSLLKSFFSFHQRGRLCTPLRLFSSLLFPRFFPPFCAFSPHRLLPLSTRVLLSVGHLSKLSPSVLPLPAFFSSSCTEARERKNSLLDFCLPSASPSLHTSLSLLLSLSCLALSSYSSSRSGRRDVLRGRDSS